MFGPSGWRGGCSRRRRLVCRSLVGDRLLGLGGCVSACGRGGLFAGRSERPRGVSVRCRAARTLCSICERRAEYIERFSTDFLRITKNTATIPTRATSGPAMR